LLSKKRHPHQVNQANQESLEVQVLLAHQDIKVRMEKMLVCSIPQRMESQADQEEKVEMVEKEVWVVAESMAEMDPISISLQINTSLAVLLKFGTLVQMEVKEDEAVKVD
jgi:hypothetical protein